MKCLSFLLIWCACLDLQAQSKPVESYKEVLMIMGTRFKVTATATDRAIAMKAVRAGIAEMERIEALISSWKPDSQTTAINRNAGVEPVAVDLELYNLIYRAKKISRLTNGAFDISFAVMDRIYEFDRKEKTLPDSVTLAEAIKKIDWTKIILDPNTHSVFLQESGMKIGFGAIGKGYAANRAKALMEKMDGVIGGVVNASGDLIVWGENGTDSGWKVQISDPKNIEQSMAWLELKNTAIVTSGDYEKYFTSQGKRYAHIINPKTGLPSTGIKSVTIICPDTELADALATSVFVLGAEKGMELINKLNGVEGLLITDADEMLTSDQLILNKI